MNRSSCRTTIPRLGVPASLLAALAVAVALGACGGNAGSEATAKRAGSAPSTVSPRYAVRGVIGHDLSRSGFDDAARIGFNVIDTGPFKEKLDALARRGLKGMIWLGGYSNTTCTFVKSDAWVRSHVAAIAHHRAVAAYYIDDEPDAAACPSAPAQIRARSQLVKSLDPRATTFIVIYRVDEFKLFAGTVDILAVDKYPCSIEHGCIPAKIDAAIAELDRLGVRYWGVIQAFGDSWYRLPTPNALHVQFVHWRASRMEGYLVFGWRWPDNDPSLWLAHHPELQRQLAVENAAGG